MTVGELLARMSSAEFAEWLGLAQLEHEERIQRQAEARAAAAVRQMQRSSGRTW